MGRSPDDLCRRQSGRIVRAATYARYSSDNQREASIADQWEICRRYCEQQGWPIVANYDDPALSGSSARLRPGFQRMVLAAEAGQFEIIVCEAVDRLGWNLADVAGLHDRLTFRGVVIHTPSTGALTAMHIGIMGTMAQLQLSDLRDKTKRGQLGRVRAGRIPGGLAYGYDVVPPALGSKEAGERRINPAEAETVRRIFREFAAGTSPRVLARKLNEAGVPGPGGRPWIDTTLRGQAARGTGILNNRLYIGELAWNRCSYVKNPRTGKREARLNLPEQWEHRSLPELRILDQALWDQAKARQAEVSFVIGEDDAGQKLNQSHRRKFVLSGLLKCGACGGGYTIMARDRYGCAAHTKSGTCGNGFTISRAAVERRVLGALQDRMLSPELVVAFVEAYQAELAEDRLQRERQAAAGRHELEDVTRRLSSVVDAMERGGWSPSLQARLSELEARKAGIEAGLPAQPQAIIPAVLHPVATAKTYRSKVTDLVTALNDPDIQAEAGEALRALIDHIRMVPDASAPDRHQLELHGDLTMALHAGTSADAGAGHNGIRPRRGVGHTAEATVLLSQVSVVAGTRNYLNLLLTG